MGFSRQEYWSGLPFPSLGDLPSPGIEPGSPALQADALTSEPPGKHAHQRATIRTGHGTTDWFQIRKGLHQSCVLSLCLFNFYIEYIMRDSGLEEAQAGIKIARRNINNLRYAGDTTLTAESQEIKNFLMKVKEESEKLA